MSIYYKAGYKYQLVKDSAVDIINFPPRFVEVETDYLWLSSYNLLIVKKGYAWDGPSGPTIDTKNFIRGSLVHDALYELIRLGHLDKNIYRLLADEMLYTLCREDGMSWLRANVVYYSVRVFGNPAARPSGEAKVVSAP